MKPGFSLQLAPPALLGAIGVTARIEAGLFAAGNDLVNEWRTVLNQPGQGETYDQELRTVTRGGISRVIPVGARPPHRASRAGQAPAPDTSAGRTSIHMEVVGRNRVRAGTDKKYLAFQHYGVGPGLGFGPHPAGIVIEPRPHADIALEGSRKKMQVSFRAALVTR